MKKRALLSILTSATGLALAYRRAGGRRERDVEPLRPGGPIGGRAMDRPGGDWSDAAGCISDGRSGDRGGSATTPIEIPPRGWFDVVKRTAIKFSENDLMEEGAGVTFFALLSIFPALAAIVSIYSLFADPRAIQDHINDVKDFVPGGGLDILHDQVRRLTSSPPSGLTFGVGAGLLAALWSANQGSKSMLSALNRVQDRKETRSFLKFTAVAFVFTLGAMLALAVAVGIGFVLPALLGTAGIAGIAGGVIRIARWPALLLALMAALATLYRFGPCEHRTRWRWVTPGGVLGALAWVALSYGFSWYVAHFGSYNRTYGSLGAVIGFMTWIWLSSTVLLVGAQLNAELEGQTGRSTTSG